MQTEALESALLAWTSMADQLPKRVTLHYDDQAMESKARGRTVPTIAYFRPRTVTPAQRKRWPLHFLLQTRTGIAILDADILVNAGHLFNDVTTATDTKRIARPTLRNVIPMSSGIGLG